MSKNSPRTLSQLLRLFDSAEEKQLIGKKLVGLKTHLEGQYEPLLDLAMGHHQRFTVDPLPSIEAGVGCPLTITKVWFAGPDIESDWAGPAIRLPLPGIEFHSMGGTVRLNSLEDGRALRAFTGHVRRYLDGPHLSEGGPVEYMNVGSVKVADRYKVVTVTSQSSNAWGVWPRDAECRVVTNSEGMHCLAIWEGWGGGNVVVVSNPDEFLQKLETAADEIVKQIEEWRGGLRGSGHPFTPDPDREGVVRRRRG